MNAMDRFRRECTAFFEALEAGAQKPLVFGDGPSDGPVLMLVGEAPGEQEALEGRPFVGKAGRNLAGFLEALGLRRSEIYITNVVKVRPAVRKRRFSPRGSCARSRWCARRRWSRWAMWRCRPLYTIP